MNERIKQLAEQAGMNLIHDNFMTASQEKFAELLVADVLNEVLKAMDVDIDVYYTVVKKFRVEV
jgi:molybdenum cofactor biosynthesis enzyme MoaA